MKDASILEMVAAGNRTAYDIPTMGLGCPFCRSDNLHIVGVHQLSPRLDLASAEYEKVDLILQCEGDCKPYLLRFEQHEGSLSVRAETAPNLRPFRMLDEDEEES